MLEERSKRRDRDEVVETVESLGNVYVVRSFGPDRNFTFYLLIFS